MRRQSLRYTLSATAVAVAWPMVPINSAVAQSTGGQIAQLEEIVVTARKIEENLMQVPMAIAAVTAADIESAGVKDLGNLSLYTPGLWAEYGPSGPGATGRQLTFRGLSVSSGLVFVDGAPYAGTGNPSIGSVERIEVLVGPQSAYFGRSTFSGAVNFVTKEPADTFKGQVNAELAKFGTTDDTVSLEGPLFGDKLGARVTGHHYQTAGMWTNYSNPTEKQGQRREDSVMGTLVAKPTDALKLKLLLGYEDEETTGMSRNVTLYGNDKQPGAVQSIFCNLGGSFGPYYCGAIPTADKFAPQVISFNNEITPMMQTIFFDNVLGFPTLFNRRFKTTVGSREVTWMGHLNIDYSFASGWDFSAITAIHKTQVGNISPQFFRDNRYTVNPNYPRTPNVLPYLGSYINGQNIIYDASQEVRLTSPQDQRLRGTVGGNYLSTRTPGSVSAGFQPAVTGLISSQTRNVTKTPAIFGGIYYDVAAQLTVSAEARYQWDNVKSQVKVPTPGPLFNGTFTSFSPRVTLDYKYADNSLAYVLWSRGYRPGGFNTQLLGQPDSVLVQLRSLGAQENYLQEKLDNYELGIKSTWLDNRLQTRLAAYYDQWRNGQVSQALNVTTPTGGVFVAAVNTNVGGVDMHGVEFGADAQASEHLNLHANFNWQHSKIKAYSSAITIRINNSDQVNGKEFPKAPVIVWALTPTYTDHLNGDWDWYVRGDWKHRGKYYIDVSNVAWIGSSNTFDLHFGVKNQNLTVEIYGTNLTNDLHILTASQGNDSICCAGSPNVNGIQVYLPDKRNFGVKASYKF